jgi:hypothetical protein
LLEPVEVGPVLEGFDDFCLQLIWDLSVEAERFGMGKDYAWQKWFYPRHKRANCLVSRLLFVCKNCGHFNSSCYITGRKPKRYGRCKHPMALEVI